MKTIIALNTVTNNELQSNPIEKILNKEPTGTFRFLMSSQTAKQDKPTNVLPTLSNMNALNMLKNNGLGRIYELNVEKTDNGYDEEDSRCCDSKLENLVDRIVSIIEGFGLLDYNTDENIEKISDFVLSSVNPNKGDTQNNNRILGMFSDEIARMPKIDQNDITVKQMEEMIVKLVNEYQCSFDNINNKGVNNNLIGEMTQQNDTKQDITKVEPNKIMFMIKTALKQANINKVDKVGFKEQKGKTRLENLDESIKGNTRMIFKNSNEIQKTRETVSKLDIEQVSSKNMAENVSRIAEKMTARTIDGKQEFNVTLKPEFLGKLSIKLIIESDGIKAHIKAGDQYVKGLISDQLPTLSEMLKEKGVNMSHIEVVYENPMSSSTDGQFQRKDWQKQDGKKNLRSIMAVDKEFEELTYNAIPDLQELSIRNSSVEFSA
ncbi:MAG: flagellar hook-length control protein FliK [Clostridiales bacterium]|nr:flagellar hook-length control protein FliK [Clostridiales bacterium]